MPTVYCRVFRQVGPTIDCTNTLTTSPVFSTLVWVPLVARQGTAGGTWDVVFGNKLIYNNDICILDITEINSIIIFHVSISIVLTIHTKQRC